jgi:uncharacterized protein YndB with AHSA1/START domain
MTHDATADGTVEKIDGKHVLRFERRLAHPVDRVWAALTEPDELGGWFGEVEIELAEGGSFSLRQQNRMTEEDVEKYGIELPDDFDLEQTKPVQGTITRLDPPRLIEYDTDHFGLLRWELREEEPGCVLTFTNTVDFPEGFPPAQTLAGWHSYLDQLEQALAGRPGDWENWTLDRWAEHRDRYAASTG